LTDIEHDVVAPEDNNMTEQEEGFELFDEEEWVASGREASPETPPGDEPIDSLMRLLAAVMYDGKKIRQKLEGLRYGRELMKAVETAQATLAEHQAALKKGVEEEKVFAVVRRLRATATDIQILVDKVGADTMHCITERT
jgi:hypothetical protein